MFFLSSLFVAVDLLYGNIYCFICCTYVYDDEIDNIAKEELDKISWIKGEFDACLKTLYSYFTKLLTCCFRLWLREK